VRTVQRTIIRPEQELDIRPLYIGGMSAVTGGQSTSRQSGAGEDWGNEEEQQSWAAKRKGRDYGSEPTGSSYENTGASVQVTGDGHARVQPHQRVTFGTYFNAFPASYWRRWTDVQEVLLRVRVSGEGTLLVYRSTSKGHVQREESATLHQDEPTTLEFRLSLKPFIDGGWYWFDIEAGEGHFVVEDGQWLVDTDRPTPGRISIGITTFNRPDFCTDQLVALGNTPEVLELVDDVYVVDQGSQKVVEHEQYAAAKEALGDKLHVIEQGNLGGSGGFSRAMMETVEKGASDYCLLLDDDVVSESEGILRAVAFADLAKKPTTVGGQMFSLYDRSVLHAYGETVEKWTWFWGPAPNTKHGHNFARQSLQGTKWLHRRIDVDYNGWWECLIPTSVIREVGLSLPMFIKWDDADFGLRSQEAGYPTVTLPGVAVWHVPWHEKDDTIDWQAYFHRRNRLVAALLHSPYDRGGALVRKSMETQIRHLMMMQYAPAEMGLLAIQDILEGPHRMHRDVLERLPELRELRSHYPDSQMKPELDQFPSAKRKKPPRRGKTPTAPKNRVEQVKGLASGAVRQFLPVRQLSKTHPEANIPHVDLRWYVASQFDSALVSAADGTSAAWYQRDPHQFRDLLRRSVALHAKLYREWPRLAEEYQRALPELASPDTWRKTFDNSVSEK
jgi:galactofuranosylgalactofuranosylrhamnosyl-N-acetylglucosaminyl-diphospho-decaprenol beta-1,5/1,6-galactofuranosyltransferase